MALSTRELAAVRLAMKRLNRLLVIVLTLTLIARLGLTADAPKEIELTSPDVRLGRDYIALPVGRILLVNIGSRYCAIKFTKAWEGEPGDEYFAEYESYYQGDGTGDFSKTNVKHTQGELWRKTPIGIGRLWIISRLENSIRCGPFVLTWGYGTNVYFTATKPIDEKRVRAAPTVWSRISEVNVIDPRLKWYGANDITERTRIPLDRLWDGKDRH